MKVKNKSQKEAGSQGCGDLEDEELARRDH